MKLFDILNFIPKSSMQFRERSSTRVQRATNATQTVKGIFSTAVSVKLPKRLTQITKIGTAGNYTNDGHKQAATKTHEDGYLSRIDAHSDNIIRRIAGTMSQLVILDPVA